MPLRTRQQQVVKEDTPLKIWLRARNDANKFGGRSSLSLPNYASPSPIRGGDFYAPSYTEAATTKRTDAKSPMDSDLTLPTYEDAVTKKERTMHHHNGGRGGGNANDRTLSSMNINEVEKMTLRPGHKVSDFVFTALTGYLPKSRAPAFETIEPKGTRLE